jgi:site-specific recombinase XerD
VLLLVSTGIRAEGLIGLQLADINLDARELTVTEKGRRLAPSAC